MDNGDKNPHFKYQIRDKKLGNVKQEKDLGIIISNNLKTSDQCTAASKKANKMLGLIMRNIDNKSPDIMKSIESFQYVCRFIINISYNEAQHPICFFLLAAVL